MVTSTPVPVSQVFGRDVMEIVDEVLNHMFDVVQSEPHGQFVMNSKTGLIAALSIEQFTVATHLQIPTQSGDGLLPKLKNEVSRRHNARMVIADVLRLSGEDISGERIERGWQDMEMKRREALKPREVPLRRPLRVAQG